MSGEALIEAVRAGRLPEVCGLVKSMTDAERRACVADLKELRKELRATSWSAPERRAYPALYAAGAACHTGVAAAASWIAGADMRWSQTSSSVLLDLLSSRSPEWLGELARRLADRPRSAEVPFDLMAGLVRLSGGQAPLTAAYVQGWVDSVSGVGQRETVLADRLRREPQLERLVTALFQTEDVGGRLAWHLGAGTDSWPSALATLAEEGLLDRGAVLDAGVARLLRGGSAAENRAFLRIVQVFAPTPAEERERIASWMALAAEAMSVVAAHAQSVVGRLALDGGLPVRQLAETSSAVLFRREKKLVRAQLVLLGKVLRKDPSTAAELLPVVAEAFGHEDTDVQERALKLVGRHAKAADDGVRHELAESARLLSPVLRPRAAELLGVAVAETAAEEYEEVLPPVPVPQRISPPPASPEEVAEECAALHASRGDTAAFERVLDGLVRWSYQAPAELVEALRPVAARSWWMVEDEHRTVEQRSRHHDVNRHFRGTPSGIDVVLATLLDKVRTRALLLAYRRGSGKEACAHSALADPLDARLWEIAHRMRTDPLPFLLATPTWETGRLDAEVLVRRLAEYRSLGKRPAACDFAQALLRVHAPEHTAAETAAAAMALGTSEGDRLARWLRSGVPRPPASQPRVSGYSILIDLAKPSGHRELREYLPKQFRGLLRPLTASDDGSCAHWDTSQARHWLAVVPGQREIVAARLLNRWAAMTLHGMRHTPPYLPLLAEADGPAGQAVHLSLAYGLGARSAEDRLAAVDALLTLAARRQLDAGLLGSSLRSLLALGAVKPTRLAEAARTAATTGAWGTVWSVLRETLPVVLFPKTLANGTPHGTGELLAVAADCAERSRAHGEIPQLAEAAARRGTSKLVTQARRLHTALTLPLPA